MLSQLCRVQRRLDELFVINAKPLDEDASVPSALTIGIPCNVPAIAGQHNSAGLVKGN